MGGGVQVGRSLKIRWGGGGGVLEGGVTELNDLGGLEQKRLDIDEDWKHEDWWVYDKCVALAALASVFGGSIIFGGG